MTVVPAVAAEDAKQVFDALFAAKIKQATSTVDKLDDVALAKELVTVGKASASTPELQALLYESAGELGSVHADGFSVGVEALQLLADSSESKQAAAREKLVDLLTKQSRLGKPAEREAATEQLIDVLMLIGDAQLAARNWPESIAVYRRAVAVAIPKKSPRSEEVKAKLEEGLRLERVEKQVLRLRERLLKDAADSAAAEELVRLYVTDISNPAEAAKYLDRVKDPSLKEFVPLLVLPADQVKAGDHLRLGEWIKSLAASQKGLPAVSLLRSAESHFARYLADPDADALSKRKAELLHGEVVKELERLQKDSTLVDAMAAHGTGPSLTIVSARYGVGDAWADVTAAMRARLKDDYLVALLQPNYMGGVDPKPFVAKVVEIKYKIGNKTYQVTGNEGGVIAIAAPRRTSAGQGLAIIDAKYGAVVWWTDVANVLTKQIKDGRLTLKADLTTLTEGKDPAPGNGKMIYVIYSWRGKQYAMYAFDGDTIQLPPKPPR